MTDEALIQTLFQRADLPPLTPQGLWRPELKTQIDKCPYDLSLKASLHLLNDDLDGCHNLAQTRTDPHSNHLHACLHRREGDYWNSKYWLSRTSYPLLSEIYDQTSVSSAQSVAKRFVDRVEEAEEGKDAGQQDDGELLKLREQQWKEMVGLAGWARDKKG